MTERTDVEARLRAYASELDEVMGRADARAGALGTVAGANRGIGGADAGSAGRPSGAGRADVDEEGGGSPGGRAASPSRRVWLAAAAVLVVVIAATAWWASGRAEVRVADEPDATILPAVTEPSTATGPEERPPLVWQQAGLATYLTNYTDAVGFGDVLVAVGMDDTTSAVASTSTDGMVWTEERRMGGGPGYPTSVAADDEVVVAVGPVNGQGRVWISTDGVTWTASTVADAASVGAVTRTADGFLFVGSSRFRPDGVDAAAEIPAAWTSADGRSWTRADLPDVGPGTASGAAASDETVVIAASAPGPIAFVASREGWDTLVVVEAGLASDVVGSVHSATWSGDRFLIAGSSRPTRAALWESPDGRSWSPVDIEPLLANDTFTRLGEPAAIGDTIVLPTSTDGYQALEDNPTWVRRNGRWSIDLRGALRAATWGDRFVAFGAQAWITEPDGGSPPHD